MKRLAGIVLCCFLTCSLVGCAAKTYEDYYNEALKDIEAEKYEEAVTALNKAIELDGTQADAYRKLAEVYGSEGDTENQIAAYQSLMEAFPDDTDVYGELADVYEAQGDTENLVKTYETWSDKDSSNTEVLNKLAQLYEETGDTDKAIAAYQKKLEASPDTDTYLKLSDLLVQAGRNDEALTLLGDAADETGDSTLESAFEDLIDPFALIGQTFDLSLDIMPMYETFAAWKPECATNEMQLNDLNLYGCDVMDTINDGNHYYYFPTSDDNIRARLARIGDISAPGDPDIKAQLLFRNTKRRITISGYPDNHPDGGLGLSYYYNDPNWTYVVEAGTDADSIIDIDMDSDYKVISVAVEDPNTPAGEDAYPITDPDTVKDAFMRSRADLQNMVDFNRKYCQMTGIDFDSHVNLEELGRMFYTTLK